MPKFWKIFLRIASLITIAIVAYWYIQERTPEPLAAIISALVAFAATFIPERNEGSEEKNTSAQENLRKELIKAVGDEFQSRLDQMLTDDIRAELSLDYTPEATQHREWLNNKGLPDELSADANMLTIFENAQRKLLIIGEPGAGKTTTLVRLGAQLIEQAREEDTQPVPVLFELSRWKSGQTIRDWLAAELKDQYALTIERWLEWLNLENPRVLPLLDGFDEVPENLREECAVAINTFAQHITVKLAICSRVKEYTLLQTELERVNALQIQPLDIPQIETYLEALGTDTFGLRATLREDADLLDMATRPLLLNTMVLAYRGEEDVTDFADAISDDNRREALFAGYIKTRLKNKEDLFPEHFDFVRKFQKMNPFRKYFIRHFRTAEIDYEDEEIRHWLGWLAWQMQNNKIQIFPIENLQPSWLSNKKQQSRYQSLSRLVNSIAFSLTIGIVVSVLSNVIAGLSIGLSVGMILGLVLGIGIGTKIKFVEHIKWSTRTALERWQYHVLLGTVFGISFTLVTPLALSVLCCVILFIILVNLHATNIRSVKTVSWSIATILRQWRQYRQHLAISISFSISMYLSGSKLDGLIIGVVVVLILMLDDGFAPTNLTTKSNPNEGIRLSFINSALFISLYCLIFSLAVFSIGEKAFILAGGLYWATQPKGGIAFLQHVALREVLWKNGYAPYNYARFLDYCVRLRLLVRVGGSYKFMHRLLQEHFAAEYINNNPETVAEYQAWQSEQTSDDD